MSVGKRLYVDWYVVAVGDFFLRTDVSSGYPELVDFDRAERFGSPAKAQQCAGSVYPAHTIYQINSVSMFPVRSVVPA